MLNDASRYVARLAHVILTALGELIDPLDLLPCISNVVRMVLGASDPTGTYRPNGQRAPGSYRIDRVV